MFIHRTLELQVRADFAVSPVFPSSDGNLRTPARNGGEPL